MNSYNAIGNVGQEPEIRYFESGSNKATFSLAVRGYKKDETHWIECEAWGKTAEMIGNYVKKGSQIGISGSLKQERWEDKETGKSRSKLIVSVDKVSLIGKKEDRDETPDF